MTQYLPPNLLALFAPRNPISFLPPPGLLPWEKKHVPYGGLASMLNEFEDPGETPAPTRGETKDERVERRRREKAEQMAYKLEQEIALWDPNDVKAGGGEGGVGAPTRDPFKTLFVARINYDTSESKLRREFESYGPIRKIKMVTDRTSGKPRGYAFIEYEHEKDMHAG